jgi:hypothetical protein
VCVCVCVCVIKQKKKSLNKEVQLTILHHQEKQK